LIVGHEPVAFLSNFYSNALLDDLNLVLFPVLQRYSAYTPYLDRGSASGGIPGQLTGRLADRSPAAERPEPDGRTRI
jgi:hypothetical protein